MRYRTTNKWDKVKDSQNLLYFVQLLEELLFEYSLDTYKPSAMNTNLLCEEALQTINEIDNGNIKLPNLQHILDELSANLRMDRVAIELITIDIDGIQAVLKNRKAVIHDKKVVVELLYGQLQRTKYKDKNEELLNSSITSEENDLSLIRSLTRSYITTLINIGYNSKYLYELVLSHFYYGSNNIVGNEAITDFLSNFSIEPNQYSVYFRGSLIFEKVKSACKRFEINISKAKSIKGIDVSNFNFEREDNEVYISVNELKAQDHYSAKESAEKALDMISTIFTLFHHKDHLSYLNECLTLDNKTGDIQQISIATNTMYKCIDSKPERAATKLNRFISEFSLKKESFKKFTRAAELHSLALASYSKQTQIINLWIALESIIPAKSDDVNISKIEHIINSVLPFLCLVYFDRLMLRFERDLLNWNKTCILKALRGISGSTTAERIVKLLSLKDYEDKREALKNEFGDFHLLSDRFNYFCEVFSDTKNISQAITNHKERVAWQIRRIYRARNLIIHSGKSPSYTEILIENTHDYLDVVMGSLMRLATKPRAIYTIEQGFKYTELSYKSLHKWLDKKDSVFTEASINRIIAKKVI